MIKYMWRDHPGEKRQESTGKNSLQTAMSAEDQIGLEDVADVTPCDMELTLHEKKSEIMASLNQLMRGIYLMALLLSRQYMEKYRESFGTDRETIIRPQIRYRTGRPVEISWVKRTISWHKPSAASRQAFKEKRDSNCGRRFAIIKSKGKEMLAVSKLDFIKRGTGLKYPNKIFDNEPMWVQMLGPALEEQFARLRKEMELIRKIRGNIQTIDTLHDKTINELGDERPRLENLKDINQRTASIKED